MLDAEAGEGAADVGEVRTVDGAAGLGGVKGPAGAVRVEGDGQAPGAEDLGQGGHDSLGGFGRPELGVEQALGGVVEHGDEGLTFLGAVGQPGVRAAVQVQELAQAGAGLAAAAVAPPGPALGHEARLLQRQPDEAVGEGHRMISPHQVMEVPDVEPGIALPVEPEDALHLCHWRLAARGQLAAIIEPQDLVGLIPGAPAPQAARMDAQDIGRLQPGEGAAERPQDDLLSFHSPLHGGREPRHRHLLGYRRLYGRPPVKRTFHVLSGADRSCAPYSLGTGAPATRRPR